MLTSAAQASVPATVVAAVVLDASATPRSRRDTSRDGVLDYFPTPPWAARAGGELIRRLDPPARTCWEPACGDGAFLLAASRLLDAVKLARSWRPGRGRHGETQR